MLSVVIVNYNAGVVLTATVQSLLVSCASFSAEIIIVDNNSSDGSIEFLESALNGEKKVFIIRNDRNCGFAAACNIGQAQAAGRWLLFINPDCEVEQNAIEDLLQVLHDNSDAGMVGGLLLNSDGTEQIGGRRAVPTPWRSFVRVFKLSNYFADRYPRLFSDFQLHKEPLPDHPIKVESISGACMLVRRDALQDVGLLDEGYFMHCEDLDWCMRFRQKGWSIIFVPTARIVHHKGTCSQSRLIFVEWHKHKGMVRFYNKFFYRQYPGILMILVVAGVWLRFGLKAIFLGLGNVRRYLG